MKRGKLMNQQALIGTITGAGMDAVRFGVLHEKFYYGLGRNQSRMEEEVKATQLVVKKMDRYKTYQDALSALGKKHSRKNDKGRPIMLDGGRYDIEDQEAYNADVMALNEEYQDAIDKYNAFMEEEVEVDYFVINGRFAPKTMGRPNPMVGALIALFSDFIEYSDDDDVTCPKCGHKWCLGEEDTDEKPTPVASVPDKKAAVN